MVIQCSECQTRFKLADDKLKPGGVKVRCSKCRHIFTVMPPAAEEAAPSSPPEEGIDFGGFNMQEEPSAGQETAGETEKTDGFDEFAPREEPEENFFATKAEGQENPFAADAEDPFAFDPSQAPAAESDDGFAVETDTDRDQVFSSAEAEDSGAFSFEEKALESDGEFSFDVPEEDGEFSFDGENSFSRDGDEFSFDEPPQQEDDLFGLDSAGGDLDSADDFKFDSPVDDGASAPATAKEKEPLPEPAQQTAQTAGDAEQGQDRPSPKRPKSRPVPRPARARRRSPLTGITIFLLVLLLGLCGAAAYIFWTGGSVDVAQLIETITGQRGLAPASGKIALSELTGSYVTNREAGTLFVIRGKALNNYTDPRSAISVKATLYDKAGKVLRQQTAFCGNPFNDAALHNFPFAKIVEGMNNQFGDSLSNLNVAPGKSIPFTIVFRNLPPDMKEFAVEAADSIPGSKP